MYDQAWSGHVTRVHVALCLSSPCVCPVLQVAVNPLMLKPATRLGEDAMLTIVDSSEYAALGEELNFWQLMVRAHWCSRSWLSL